MFLWPSRPLHTVLRKSLRFQGLNVLGEELQREPSKAEPGLSGPARDRRSGMAQPHSGMLCGPPPPPRPIQAPRVVMAVTQAEGQKPQSSASLRRNQTGSECCPRCGPGEMHTYCGIAHEQKGSLFRVTAAANASAAFARAGFNVKGAEQ